MHVERWGRSAQFQSTDCHSAGRHHQGSAARTMGSLTPLPVPTPTRAQMLATQVLALQPCSFGPRANTVPARVPALCLPSGHLQLCPILRHCTALERLSLAGLHRIASDELLHTVAHSCPRLREVVLDFCGGMTTAGLQARRLPGLLCRRSIAGSVLQKDSRTMQGRLNPSPAFAAAYSLFLRQH